MRQGWEGRMCLSSFRIEVGLNARVTCPIESCQSELARLRFKGNIISRRGQMIFSALTLLSEYYAT